MSAGQNRLSGGAGVVVDNTVNPSGTARARRRLRAGMHFSELFIRRPVLSTVLAAFILLLGFQGIFNLPVRQYPEVEETVVTVTTVYPGASPDLIQGFVTSPIAAAVATTENIDYVTSQSTPSASVVSVNMKLGADPDVALTEVLSKVQGVRGQLPEDAEDPVIVKGTGMQFALMYLAAVNPNMTQEQMTEYLERVIRPRMSTIEGVAEIEIIGAANYAMRVWIDPLQLAARGVTASEVLTAIRASNFLAAPGKTENEFVAQNINMQTTLQTPEAFGQLPISRRGRPGGAPARRRARSSSPTRSSKPSSPSTPSPAPSSASSRPRPRTRSTPPRRWWTSCRRSTPACRRACRSSSSTTRPRRSRPRSRRCSRPSPRRSPSSSSSSCCSSARSARC